MKKILFVNATLGLGGVERSLVDLVNRMNENKYDIYLYCDSTEGGLASQLDKKVQIIEPNLNGSYGRFYNACQYLLSTHQYGKLAYRFTRALTNKLGMKSLFLLKPFLSDTESLTV